MTLTTIAEATQQVMKNLEKVASIGGSYYFNLELNEDETIKIRVSDHSANSSNNRDRTISFVTNWVDQGYKAMRFEEYEVNADGSMTENWMNVAECLEYILD